DVALAAVDLQLRLQAVVGEPRHLDAGERHLQVVADRLGEGSVGASREDDDLSHRCSALAGPTGPAHHRTASARTSAAARLPDGDRDDRAMPDRPRTPRRLLVGGLVVALVVAGVLAVWLLRRAPEPPTPAWRVEVEDVTDADHARCESVTGATGRPQRVGDLLLATVVTSSAGRYLADMTGSVLVAVDPVTGEIVWQLPFAAPDERSVTRCAVTDAATIICVGAV